MEFPTLPEFDGELKKLLKKYHSLEEDLNELKDVLRKFPRGYEPVVFRMAGLKLITEVYKVKHFRCKALRHKGSRSGVRVIYVYKEQEQVIEFVEIYYKEKDDLECDKERLSRHYA